MIYKLPENCLEMKHFPSPKDLKRKILLKGKGKLEKVLDMDLDTLSEKLTYQEMFMSRKYLDQWRALVM